MVVLCHFLIGIPGSGKSTFAQQLAEVTQGEIVSTDDIRSFLYSDASIQGNWQEIEAEVIQRITAIAVQDQPIIYDATNVKRQWRIQFLSKMPPNTRWIAWCLQTPLTVCQQRNQKRGHEVYLRHRKVPDAILLKMQQSLWDDPPQISEGFLAVKTVY